MECIICHREGGNDSEGVITLQSTPHGTVCPRCINQLVGDVIKMRTPWTEEDLKDWGYDMGIPLKTLLVQRDWFLKGGEEE
jgi:hypothetical protein